ncbi:hypothetical protein BB559_004764 [Furculomyces boomerangus]|uniref:Uncharacterized protein n=1 Tax=Furculomyces boomerangus TaxID=61424 RepID=A0A2T9YCZ0_9FUNG|nr:hypothetical protein BB559_004764 [Furculomyces boomerangus]
MKRLFKPKNLSKNESQQDKNIKPNGRLKGYSESSFWQRITFSWCSHLIWNYGRYDSKITSEILPDLDPSEDSKKISILLENAWNEEVRSGRKSLWGMLYKVYGKEFLIAGFFGFLESLFKVLQAVALGLFIKFLRSSEKSISQGFLYAGMLSIIVICASLSKHYHFFPASRLGFRLRIGLISLLYRKALTISASSMISTGEAVNLISNDVQPFDNGASVLHFMWLGPVELIMSLVFLWLNIGISGLVPIGIYALMIPLQSYISLLFGKIRLNTVNFRDSRIKLLTDIISGMEVVKLNAWEIPLLKRITNLRKKEYNSLNKATTLKGLNESFFMVSSQLVQLGSFITLWCLVVLGLGNNIGGKGAFQPENIFPCITLFAVMRLTMTLFVPKAFEAYGEMKVSVKRIEDFLLLSSLNPQRFVKSDQSSLETNNKDNNDSSSKPRNDENQPDDFAIVFKNASFSWKSSPEGLYTSAAPSINTETQKSKNNNESTDKIRTSFDVNNLSSLQDKDIVDVSTKKIQKTLIDINLSVKSSELLGVIGSVGSGKSSLCNSILGEMQLLNGDYFVSIDDKNNQPTNAYGDSSSSLDKNKKTIENSFGVGYCSQSPWIFSGTIKENILFGEQYDKDWFEKVVFACSLTRDFELFEKREYTIIGERGTTLSGGQRARISLARAVYIRSNLYILDDPLSAVDPKVAKHIFEHVICGLLKDKTRILVTHQLQFINKCNKVLVLQKGRMLEYGTPESISKLSDYNNQDEEIDDNESRKIESVLIDGTEIAESGFEMYSSNNYIQSKVEILEIEDDSENISFGNHIQHKSYNSDYDIDINTKDSDYKEPENSNSYEIGGSEEIKKTKTSFKTYLNFFRFGASPLHIAICIILTICTQSINMNADYFLSKWSSMPQELKARKSQAFTYMGLVIGSFFMSIITCILLYRLVLSSSNGLMHKMLISIMNAPISFFQSQPLGRILNRFSKDQSNTDEILAPSVIYLKTSRQVKNIESVSRSPVYSLLSETLSGMITIRAFNKNNRFLSMFADYQNTNSRAFFTFLSAIRWFSFRLDIIISIFIAVTSFLMIAIHKSLTPSLVALSMSYILTLVGMVQWCIIQSIEVETMFISVERNIEYTKIKPEEPQQQKGLVNVVPQEWPDKGKIEIKKLNLAYSSNSNPVLKDITLSIESQEKIGIVGRTGAGKSSLVSSLFRLAEPYPNGCIHIDDINISEITLKKLRSSISMIPQQPFLFEGTLRFNLDPFDEYTDEEIWMALEASSIKTKVEDMPEKLNSLVIENGKNFSAGERQLISLCRAILHNKKVIVIDEATANVDLETDKQIQQSIYKNFNSSTVITIAHRLDTVIGAGYDKIVVLDHGKLMEFGTPHELLSNPKSLLSAMVSDTGPTTENILREKAFEEHKKKMGIN